MIEREVPPRPDARERWAKTRLRGRGSYILRVGVLQFGLLYATVSLLTKLFFVWLGAEWNLIEEGVRIVVVAPLFGALMGWWLWRSMERRFGPDADSHGTPPI